MQHTDTAEQPLEPLGLRELTELLVRHYGLTSGKYILSAEFHVGAGMFGPDESKLGPGFAIGMSRIGLSKAPTEGPYTVDASTFVNRESKAPKKVARKSAPKR